MPERLRFDRFELRPAERRLLRDGEPVQLGARAFDLLLALAQHPDRLLTKGELLDLAWPGLVVEEANIQVQVSALRKLLGPHAVATIPGLGYRFSAALETQTELAPASHINGGADAGYELPLPDIPSIAVLPFVNLSVDPDQEHFADGVTEDIITQMSRFKSLFVIARNSSFSYKNKAVDIRQIGRELGVRYVVEGSIRRSNNRVRLTARLVDSFSATHVWAETYDRVLEDIFAVQEEVTECIAAAIAPNIDEAEMLKARSRPNSVSAYEMALLARALARREWEDSDPAAGEQALAHARSALRIDPDSVIALDAIASVQFHRINLRTVADRESAWREGIAAADRAISVAHASSSHAWKALVLLHTPERRRWDEALVEARMAYQLNPQDSFAVMVCGHVIGLLGEPAEAIRLLERGLRINPRDPAAYNTYTGLALCHLLTKEYRKGVEWAMRATAAAPGNCLAHLSLAALLVGLDELGQARAALEVARRLAPAYVQSRLDGHATIREGEYRQRFTTFIRIAAGLEDPDTAKPLR